MANATANDKQGSPAIETQGLTKSYGRLVAVDKLDLLVERGEIFGFLGPNGAGKTTTMRMLLGLVQPTGGGARVLGMDIGAQLAAILERTGSIIENPTFYPFLSGRDNMKLVAKLTGTAESRVAEVLELVELTQPAGRKFKTYSLGMKQRLAVGAAVLTNPDLLILDEPANGLDPAGIIDMRNLMRRLKESGHTVLVSSHVLHEIEQVCDRIAILVGGKIAVQGSVQELLSAQGRVEVRIDDAARAETLLRKVPWVKGVTNENGSLLIDAPVDRSADLNRALAEEGLFASVIRPYEQTLEQYFMEVTEADAA